MSIPKYAHATTQSSNLSVMMPSRHVTASRWYNHQGSPKTRASTSASSSSSALHCFFCCFCCFIFTAHRYPARRLHRLYNRLPSVQSPLLSCKASVSLQLHTSPTHRASSQRPPHSAWLLPCRMHEIPALLCSIRPAASEITGLMR